VAAAAPQSNARANWALFAAVLGSSMSFIDGSAVNVALPILQRDLHASSQSVQWVVESYSLFLASLMLIGGSLGDIFGRRLVFAGGIALFAVASLACAVAPNVELLIAGRSLQGIGGALATPGSLALLSANFSGAARGRAIGTWSGFSAVTAALGPVLGGWLVQLGSWRWVFIINVPLAIVVLAVVALRVDESRDEGASRAVDVPGALLATAGLGALVYGLIRLQGATFDVAGAATSVAGVVALGLFVLLERRESHPMVRLDLFRSRTFSMANVYTFLLYATIGGGLYFIPFDLINVQGYPPSEAGAALLPFVAIMFAFSRFSGGLVARIGARIPLAAGAVLAGSGFLVFAFAGVGHSYWTTFFPGALLLGCGGALFVAPLTTTVMDAVDVSHAGIASGVNNAVSRVAGLIAIAALGIALATVFEGRLTSVLAQTAISAASRAAVASQRSAIVAGAVPAGITGTDRTIVGNAVRAAFADGFRAAMIASALLAFCAALIGLDRSFARKPLRSEPSSG
jgi:EmrB/QacA subfamily drug resistance transporter